MVTNNLHSQSSSWEQQITNIYKSYLNDIAPFIILIETLDSEYPAEIMNEIRAVFTHLSRYYEFIETKDKLNGVIIMNTVMR